ncbi:hypothetical protein SAMN05216223_102153 [Actinacidiphila yanglinensis]|uniref:Uncharacterized protein n=1 Tax=Actinacidiphila yanglinensis TaxID=310779 RepID=A0A1H5V6L9_9ACTN|nr:hypothetical protein [Actinacidiphila yanglinensis]SEF82398.1 hypothetical protein SAMN05216223_102153 [Actinacidiphila yanglinensis]
MPETPEIPDIPAQIPALREDPETEGTQDAAGTVSGEDGDRGTAEPEAEHGDAGFDLGEPGFDHSAPVVAESLVPESVRQVAARATLPFQAARADLSFGTAFWYNDLIETGGDHEVIRQYLVTATSRTLFEIGQWTLRGDLTDPEQPVDELVMGGFAKRWKVLEGLGVAVMPTVELHLHAERKGWRWDTQEITDGLAAQADDIAAIGAEPMPAYILGHEADDSGRSAHPDRTQRLLAGEVCRPAPDAPLTWSDPLPTGFDGAPVFAALPLPDEQLKLLCLGVALPGEGGPDAPATVVAFADLRPAIHALAPHRRRHWWQRG